MGWSDAGATQLADLACALLELFSFCRHYVVFIPNKELEIITDSSAYRIKCRSPRPFHRRPGVPVCIFQYSRQRSHGDAPAPRLSASLSGAQTQWMRMLDIINTKVYTSLFCHPMLNKP